MRYNTFKQYHYTADLWQIELDSDGKPVRETFQGTRRLSIDTADVSNLFIDTTEPLRQGTVLRNIKDREGVLIYPATATSGDTNSGESYLIYSEQPILSPFGTREGFTSRARRLSTA